MKITRSSAYWAFTESMKPSLWLTTTYSFLPSRFHHHYLSWLMKGSLWLGLCLPGILILALFPHVCYRLAMLNLTMKIWLPLLSNPPLCFPLYSYFLLFEMFFSLLIVLSQKLLQVFLFNFVAFIYTPVRFYCLFYNASMIFYLTDWLCFKRIKVSCSSEA